MSKAVPKLRFKEFKDAWATKKLDDVTEKVNSGKTPLGGESVYVSSGVLFIRSQNVLDSNLSLDSVTYITEEVNSTMLNSVVKPKDILLNITGASLGRSCVVPKSFTVGNVNQHVCIVRLNKNNDPYFLQPIFASRKGQNLFESLQTGSGREGLNFQSIKAISLAFPSLPEQQKIASFLSEVDKKIQQLTRKKELLEQYKKGVMQQLFSSGLGFMGLKDDRIDTDENNPPIQKSDKSQFRQLRFKDENGKAYPKWEEKRLGEILDYIQPTNYLVESTEYDDSYSIPVVTAGKTFILGYTNEEFGIFNENLPVIIFDDFTTATQFVDFPFKAKSSAMKILVAKENQNIHYVYSAMQLIRFEVGGHGRHWISQYSQLTIPYPCPEEQQKIADFLSAIDSKIESVSTQIEQTQNFKKGLLQQMFV